MLNFKKKKFQIFTSDSLNFLKKLPDNSIDLIVTDPAYSGMNNYLQLGKGRIVGKYKDKGEKGKWFAEFTDNEENYSNFLSQFMISLPRPYFIKDKK